MKAYINGCEVEKYYGSDAGMTKAVDRVSFQVAEGEFVGVMGASGSGKTTLLNMLYTIDSVTSGHIYYQDTDITELNPDRLAKFRKENLGFVFQDYNLLDTLTIRENIANQLMKDLAILQKQNPSAVTCRKSVMCHHENRRVLCLIHLLKCLQQCLCRLRVQCSCGLVGKKELRTVDERPRTGAALLLP